MVTAVRRGTANTRWLDFADILTLSNHHPVDGSGLQSAIRQVAWYRRAALVPLRAVLEGYAFIAQANWAPWVRRSGYNHLPELFEVLLDDVIRFAEPVLSGEIDGRTRHPGSKQWQRPGYKW